jgi:endonuclease/exonuclease/phosphatase family metal-dependent hydrolase
MTKRDKLALFANVVMVFVTFICYAIPHFNPKSLGIISYIVLFYPFILTMNILFISYWIIRKPIYLLISTLVLLVGLNYHKSFFAFNFSSTADTNKGIQIMSFNTSNLSFNFDKSMSSQERQKAVKEFLAGLEEMDIFCFQEITPYSVDIINSIFKNYYSHWPKKGTGIYSKYKIIQSGYLDVGAYTNSCIWADIKLVNDTVRVYSVHLESNRISRDADELAETGSLTEEATWTSVKEMLRKYKLGSLARADQVKTINEHLYQSPYPVIFCGDLNDTPVSYTYRQLVKHFNDAFIDKGTGIGSTYNGVIPFLRIDYILLTPEFEVMDFEVIKNRYSDHYPVRASILLK